MGPEPETGAHRLFAAAQQALSEGNTEAGVAQLQELARLSPEHAGARNLLGFVALRAGNHAEAEACFREAVSLAPAEPVFRENLELALSLRTDNPAATAIRNALARTPAQPALWLALARLEATSRGPEAAAALLYEGLVSCPGDLSLLHFLANVLHQAGRLAEAVVHYQHCLALAPASLDVRLDLSLAWQRLLQLERAESLAREVVEREPGFAAAHARLGAVLYLRYRHREAIASFERALALRPQDARTHNQLGMARMSLGETQDALASFREAVRLQDDYRVARSNLMLALLYDDAQTGTSIHLEAIGYGKSLGAAVPAPRAIARDPHQRLRVGFVSGDFRRHVVGTFLLPLFERHDRARLEFVCYSAVDVPDPFTQTLRKHASGWVDTRALDDDALASRIRRDGIDVLVDLAGHTSDNRLAVFARRPAPVQATWLGYPGTTGAPGIDYRLTDAVLDPEGSEAQSTEAPVRLPAAFFCYVPPTDWGGSLSVAPPPCGVEGPITFGAFNNLAKLSPSCFGAWREILRRVPGSRLLARAKPFDDPAERARFVASLAGDGVDSERIEALPYLPDPAAHLRIYDRVDIHLDSLPYAGGTTSCDALWMGVPVVTLAGDRPSARLGASVMHALGLDEWIASTPDGYVDIAVRHAGNRDALAALRGTLRDQFRRSPLHDAQAFAIAFERALRSLWQRA